MTKYKAGENIYIYMISCVVPVYSPTFSCPALTDHRVLYSITSQLLGRSLYGGNLVVVFFSFGKIELAVNEALSGTPSTPTPVTCAVRFNLGVPRK